MIASSSVGGNAFSLDTHEDYVDALNDPAFVRKLMAGDAIAFSALCDALKTKLPAFIAREIGLSYPDAEEVASDVLYKLHSSINQYQPRPNVKFTTWLFQIAKNASIDRKRKMTLRSAPEAEARAADNKGNPKREKCHMPVGLRFEANAVTDADPRDGPKIVRYKEAFEKLEESDKDILRMRHIMEYSEISFVEGEEIGTLRTRHFRALKRLRDLSQNGGD
ncbi:MAG TPA: sigma-70 family RNA polymerase sigma factor [Pyrinomonadaceae bacterium]